jgi:hypothetical protein
MEKCMTKADIDKLILQFLENTANTSTDPKAALNARNLLTLIELNKDVKAEA